MLPSAAADLLLPGKLANPAGFARPVDRVDRPDRQARRTFGSLTAALVPAELEVLGGVALARRTRRLDAIYRAGGRHLAGVHKVVGCAILRRGIRRLGDRREGSGKDTRYHQHSCTPEEGCTPVLAVHMLFSARKYREIVRGLALSPRSPTDRPSWSPHRCRVAAPDRSACATAHPHGRGPTEWHRLRECRSRPHSGCSCTCPAP